LTGDFYDNGAQGMTALSLNLGIFNFGTQHASLGIGLLPPPSRRFPFNITANTFFLDLSIGTSGVSTGAFSSTIFVGVYTSNGISLSLLNSASVSFGFAAAATDNTTGFVGQRFLSILSSQWSSAPAFAAGSQYFIGTIWSSAGVSNSQNSILGLYQFSNASRSGTIGVSQASNVTRGMAPFYGVYSATTNAFPGSIHNSELTKVFANDAFMPHLIMVNNTAVTLF
jgi:hypothetical protein